VSRQPVFFLTTDYTDTILIKAGANRIKTAEQGLESCIYPCNAPSFALKGTRLSHPYVSLQGATFGRTIYASRLRPWLKSSGIGFVEVGGQPRFLTQGRRC